MTAPILRLRDVVRTHGDGDTAVHALRGVSLDVFPGELVAVMGPSGSGKSTLLNLAGGLDKATGGQVFIEDAEIGSLTAGQLAALRRRRVGFVFQDFNLIPSLTASENVSLPLELDGTSVREARAAARAVLETVGVVDLADRYPDKMSGGQQQRVAIARALVGDRHLLLADEPTGALDSDGGEEILELFRRLHADNQQTILLITHDQPVADAAQRLVRMRDGRVVDAGAPAGRQNHRDRPIRAADNCRKLPAPFIILRQKLCDPNSTFSISTRNSLTKRK